MEEKTKMVEISNPHFHHHISTGHRGTPLECHNLGVTICDLFEKCGLSFQQGSTVGDRILGCTHP